MNPAKFSWSLCMLITCSVLTGTTPPDGRLPSGDTLELVLAILKSDNVEQAYPILADTMERSPETLSKDSLLSFARGLLEMKRENFTKAAESMEETVEKEPGLKEAWIHLIECQRQRDDRSGFLEATDRFLNQYPDDEVARLICGRAWMQLGDWERVDRLRAMYKLENEPVGKVQDPILIKEEPFQSLIMLDYALQKDPRNPDWLFQMGNLLCTYQNCEEGIRYFELLNEQKPDDLRTIVNIARASRAVKDAERGLKAVDQATGLMENASLPENMKVRLERELDALTVFFLDLQLVD